MLTDELNYELRVDQSGHETFEAFRGSHGDLVTALGLALQDDGPRRAISLGRWRGEFAERGTGLVYPIGVLPFEFTITGTPVSQQTANRTRLQRWKSEVRAAAARHWPATEPPLDAPLCLKITYYYIGDPLDIDNMIKPVQDALVGLAYVDDRQVCEVRAQRRPLDGTFRLRGLTAVLANGFVSGAEFLHVVVLPSPDLEVLP